VQEKCGKRGFGRGLGFGGRRGAIPLKENIRGVWIIDKKCQRVFWMGQLGEAIPKGIRQGGRSGEGRKTHYK